MLTCASRGRRRATGSCAGASSPDTDWWYLVFDTDSAYFGVAQEWGDHEEHRRGKVTGGTVLLEVAAYLSRTDDPGQRELARLICTMFESGEGSGGRLGAPSA
jgi:hypothetical protein